MRHIGRHRCGFTLIELLVVIGIIAVLAAIIFPVLSNARHKARKFKCLANLHQLHVAMMLYKDDAGGFLPSWCITNPDPNNPGLSGDALYTPQDDVWTWDRSILDYTQGSEELLVCWDNPVAGNADEGDPEAKARTARAYAMPRYTQWKASSGNYYGIYLEQIPNPSATVLLFEKGGNRPGTWGDALGENVYQSHDCRDHADAYRDDMFHFGGKNFLFADGSTKWFKGGEGLAPDESIPDPPADASTIDPTNPFSWDSGRRGNKNCGPGVCEVPAPYSPTAIQCGDWPPLEWPPPADQWPPE